MAVADLDKAKFTFSGVLLDLGQATQTVGPEYSAFDHTKSAGSGPSHALQEPTAVNSIMVVVVQDLI
jgi:hypothetical protein